MGGRPDSGDRTERQGGMSCRRNFRPVQPFQECAVVISPSAAGKFVIERRSERRPAAPRSPSWASIASTSVAPPPELCRRDSRHQIAAPRFRSCWPDLFFSGCAARTDRSALPRAAAGAVTTNPQARAATMEAMAATRRAPSAARPRSIPAATTTGCATPAAHPCSCSRRRKALHRVAAGLQP